MSRHTTQELSRVASRQIDRLADAAGHAMDQAHDAADQAVTSVQNGAQDLARQAPGLVDLAIDRVKNLGAKGSDLARACPSSPATWHTAGNLVNRAAEPARATRPRHAEPAQRRAAPARGGARPPALPLFHRPARAQAADGH